MAAATVQRQARALGDPTRYSLFTWIGAQPEPVTISDLLRKFHLNHTTIRQHLSQLSDAGLLVESRATPVGPGRPKRLYQVAPDARGSWTNDGPYENLSVLLLEVLRSGRDAVEVGREAGRKRVPIARTGATKVETLVDEVSREGFAPTVDETDSAIDLVLTRCPFAAAAAVDPTTVCALHRGLAEGLAESIGDLTVTELVVRSPKQAGCRLRVAEVA